MSEPEIDDVPSARASDTAPSSVLEMFAWREQHDPGAVFVITPDGRERTYAQLGDAARSLAAALVHTGVGPGDIVGVYAWNDPAWVVASFATWMVGAGIAASGGLTTRAEVERRFDLVEPAGVVVVTGLTAPGGVPTITVDPDGTVLGGGSVPAVTTRSVGLDDTAAVFFTSGTTGASKPVVYSHRRLADGPRMTAGAYARSAGFRPRTAPIDRAPAIGFNPFGHTASMGRMVFRMYVGRSLLLVPKFDVSVLQTLADRYPLDTLQLTPAMIHAIAYSDLDLALGSLKYVNSGTAPLPFATRERFEARYGVPILQAYGSTEGGVTALERYDDAIAGRRGPGSVGRVPDDMPFRIVDGAGEDVPPGHEGELVGRVEASSQRYLATDGQRSLQIDDEGWYHTGDIGRLDADGILYITGRIKEMMIVGGFNVYPGEVEDAVRSSPLVRDVVVVPKPDDRLGEIPVAGVVWEQPSVSDEGKRVEQLRAHCRVLLEAYKVPRQYFSLTDLPLSANGKLDRRTAAELAGAALAAVDDE